MINDSIASICAFSIYLENIDFQVGKKSPFAKLYNYPKFCHANIPTVGCLENLGPVYELLIVICGLVHPDYTTKSQSLPCGPFPPSSLLEVQPYAKQSASACAQKSCFLHSDPINLLLHSQSSLKVPTLLRANRSPWTPRHRLHSPPHPSPLGDHPNRATVKQHSP